jgi:hypothetical protein
LEAVDALMVENADPLSSLRYFCAMSSAQSNQESHLALNRHCSTVSHLGFS